MKLGSLSLELTSALETQGECVSLHTVWTGLAEAAAEQAESKGVEIDVRVRPDAGLVTEDPVAMMRVFRNLLSAALHLTARDTCVAISTQVGDDEQIIQLESCCRGESGGRPQVSLHRMQTGIPSEARFAVHAAKEFARAHGGTLDAAFVQGLGARFVLRLPHEPCRAGGSAQESRVADAG